MCEATIPGTNYDIFDVTQSPINGLEDLLGLPSDLTDISPDYPDPSGYPNSAPTEFTYEPATRDYYAETADTLQAQIDMAPELFRSNLKYMPAYAGLNYRIQSHFLPKYAEVGRGITTAGRTQDMADLQALAPQVTDAYRLANPEAAALLDELNKEAAAQLATGGALTPDEQRAVEQNSRAAYNDRGMVLGDPAVFSEVMNLDAAKRTKQKENQALASSVLGLNKSIYGDPVSVILGRPSSNLGFEGIPAPTSSNSTDIFNPESAYANNVYSGNQNATNQANAATANANSDYFSLLYNSGVDQANTTANNNAALLSSLLSAGGNVAAAGFS